MSWRRLHRFLGLIFGLWLTWQGLTGSMLVLMRQLPPVPARAAGRQASLEERKRAAGDVKRYVPGPRPGTADCFTLRSGGEVYVDPGDATILKAGTPTDWPLKLHRLGESLFLPFTAAAMLVLLSGWVLQPPKMRVLGRPFQQVPLDFHRRLGWLITAPLLFSLATGVGLANFRRLAGPQVKPKAQTSLPAADLDTLVAAARQALPDARIVRLDWPAKPQEPVTVRMKRPQEPHPNGRSYVYLEPGTGAVLKIDDAVKNPSPWNYLFGWHTQPWWLFLLGLSPAAMMISGLGMRRNRLRKGRESGK